MKGIRRAAPAHSATGGIQPCPFRLCCRGQRGAGQSASPTARGLPRHHSSSQTPAAHNLTDHQPPHAASSDEPPAHATWSRRAALLSLPLFSGALLPTGWRGSAWAAVMGSRPLRSLGWTVPCELTILNDLEDPLKVYWLNYDGDAELFGSLSPGSVFTVQTFETHAWRFVDASSGTTVAEHVATAGQQIVRVASRAAAAAASGAAGGVAGPGGPGRPGGSPTASYTYTTGTSDGQQWPRSGGPADSVASAPASASGSAEGLPGGEPGPRRTATATGGSRSDGMVTAAAFEGFDGLGNEEQQYCLAQLREIKIYPGGGNVMLALPGIQHPLEVALAGPEALSLVVATGSLEQRRPSTLGTWTRSLMASGADVRRVCITRVVDGIYYCRIVLSRPDASLCSLDATPGDSLSLALQLGRPIYVANDVARVHQSVLDVFARRRRAMEAAAARGALDEAAEAEADREAQDALDSITRGLPSAPRPVRAVEMDHQLDA